jgi:hypothetical protein
MNEHAEDLDLEPADADSVVGGSTSAELDKSIENELKSIQQKPPKAGTLKAPPKGL